MLSQSVSLQWPRIFDIIMPGVLMQAETRTCHSPPGKSPLGRPDSLATPQQLIDTNPPPPSYPWPGSMDRKLKHRGRAKLLRGRWLARAGSGRCQCPLARTRDPALS